ncbi:hypothetical protein M8J75_000410 [Diaphorina citri]|nr:hypothetical protein M8J75_000410 [Diaphorina citri]
MVARPTSELRRPVCGIRPTYKMKRPTYKMKRPVYNDTTDVSTETTGVQRHDRLKKRPVYNDTTDVSTETTGVQRHDRCMKERPVYDDTTDVSTETTGVQRHDQLDGPGPERERALPLPLLVKQEVSVDEACSMQKVPSLSDLSDPESSLDIPTQVPPLTPGTNKKMTEALKASFASWEKEQIRLNIVKDPRQWSESNVAQWLCWAIREFSLEGVTLHQFYMRGKDICSMGKESFLARAPPFMGDILSTTMVGIKRGAMAVLGNPRVLIGGSDAASVLHARQRHLLDGQRILPGAGTALHGRHPVGTSRNFTER